MISSFIMPLGTLNTIGKFGSFRDMGFWVDHYLIIGKKLDFPSNNNVTASAWNIFGIPSSFSSLGGKNKVQMI